MGYVCYFAAEWFKCHSLISWKKRESEGRKVTKKFGECVQGDFQAHTFFCYKLCKNEMEIPMRRTEQEKRKLAFSHLCQNMCAHAFDLKCKLDSKTRFVVVDAFVFWLRCKCAFDCMVAGWLFSICNVWLWIFAIMRHCDHFSWRSFCNCSCEIGRRYICLLLHSMNFFLIDFKFTAVERKQSEKNAFFFVHLMHKSKKIVLCTIFDLNYRLFFYFSSNNTTVEPPPKAIRFMSFSFCCVIWDTNGKREIWFN